jgi:hypothetical protein
LLLDEKPQEDFNLSDQTEAGNNECKTKGSASIMGHFGHPSVMFSLKNLG